MNKRIIGQFGILAAVLLATVSPNAIAQSKYALAVSSSTLYQVKMDGTTLTNTPIFNLGNSTWGRSITTYTDTFTSKDYVLVTEIGSSGSSVRKLELTSTHVVDHGKISLTSGGNTVNLANSIAVDSNNGVYVGDGSSGTAHYAYISPSGTVSVNSIGHAPLCDVAASGAYGVVISQHSSDVSDMSYSTTLTAGAAGSPSKLSVGSDIPRYPVAVAARGDNAYVASEVMTSYMSGNGALSVYNIAAGSAGSPITLTDFVPSDVTTFALDGVDYVALIGKTSGGHLQAWKAAAGGLSSSTVWSKEDLGVDGSVDFQCAASHDGTLLWFNQPMKNSVGVLYTGSFYTADTDDQITGLAAFTETMTPAPPVPEPSSLLALASLGAGALGFLRKRKQA